MTFRSSKTYGHEIGLSACFRQWKAHSHCKLLHGYALSIHLEFEADHLDDRNWVVDFGGLRSFKAWIEDTFDHKMLVAEDDPQLPALLELGRLGLARPVVIKAVGCEAFAEMIFLEAQAWLIQNEYAPRVRMAWVTVREHGANSATYMMGRQK